MNELKLQKKDGVAGKFIKSKTLKLIALYVTFIILLVSTSGAFAFVLSDDIKLSTDPNKWIFWILVIGFFFVFIKIESKVVQALIVLSVFVLTFLYFYVLR